MGTGDEEHFYLETISNIVIKIADILKIKPEKTTFYGSSAGDTPLYSSADCSKARPPWSTIHKLSCTTIIKAMS